MAIDPTKLVSAAIMQDIFNDESTGTAMAAGTITMYQDNARTVYKNWYYQSGAPSAYTYLPLDNPLTLSAAGTITDPNGNDTIPFYYPFSESDNTTPQTYYVVVVNSNGQSQFTRQNFPQGNTSGSSGNTDIPTLKNLVVNNRFWRNICSGQAANGDSLALNITSTNLTVCPSQHNGFSMPDIQYMKDNTSATETVNFPRFALGVLALSNDIQPEYYLNHNCSVAGAETYKYYQIPICLHIRNLDGQAAAFTIQAQAAGGGTDNSLDIRILQFNGTNEAAVPTIPVGIINPTAQWQKYTFNFNFNPGTGAALAPTGDDAYYLQIRLKAGQTCNVNFALPSIYLCNQNQVPTDDFASYDEIDWEINSPRTGDYKYSVNLFGTSPNNFGWVGINGGSIGNYVSGATARANQDTWPLYNLLWNAVPNPPLSATSTLTAYGDFNAGIKLSLPQVMSRVLAAANGALQTFAFTVPNANEITPASAQTLIAGTPMQFYTAGTPPTGLTNNIYYLSVRTPSVSGDIVLSPTLDDALNPSGTQVMISAGTGTGPFYMTTPVEVTGYGASFNTQVPMHSHVLVDNSVDFVMGDSNSATPRATAEGGTNYDLFSLNGTYQTSNQGTNIVTQGGVSTLQPTGFANMFLKL